MPGQSRDDIDTKIYASNKAYGGTGGSRFKVVGALKGATITSIQGWQGQWQLRGLKVKFSDGKNYMFGEAAETSTPIFRFENGETLIDLKFYDSSEKSSGGYYRSGGVSFKTNKGRSFSAISKNTPSNHYYEEVGSGPLCGVFGAMGADIDSLGFAMLRRVKSAVLIDMKYPGLHTMPVAVKPDSVDHIDYDNNTTKDQNLTLKGETTITTETSWSVATSMEFGISVSVKAGVPEVAEFETEASWTIGREEEHARTTTEEVKRLYDFPIVCPPGKKIVADAILYHDKISTDYEADMTYNLDTGYVIKYHVEGVYDGLTARGVEVDIHEFPLS